MNSTLRARLFSNWHLIRIFRLGIGITMLVAGIQGKDWMIGLLSAFFLYQAITNTGCCGISGCSTPKAGKAEDQVGGIANKTAEYEEIK